MPDLKVRFLNKKKLLYIEYLENGEKKGKFFQENETVYFGPPINHCPVCKGTGTQTITCIGFGNDPKTEEKSTITCIHCNGKPMSEIEGERLKKILEREKNMWCKCGAKNGARYIPDTKRMKHYWLCNDCNKIAQNRIIFD